MRTCAYLDEVDPELQRERRRVSALVEQRARRALAAAWWAVDLLASDVPSGGARVALGKYEYGFNTAV